MSNGRAQSAIDWAGSFRGYTLTWGLPHVAGSRSFRDHSAASSYLVNRARLDGNRLHRECPTLSPHALPLRGTVLLGDDCPFLRPGLRDCFGRDIRIAPSRRRQPGWRQADLVANRTGVGQVFLGPVRVILDGPAMSALRLLCPHIADWSCLAAPFSVRARPAVNWILCEVCRGLGSSGEGAGPN